MCQKDAHRLTNSCSTSGSEHHCQGTGRALWCEVFRQFSVLKALMVCPLAAHKHWLAFGQFWRLPASNSSALPMTGLESAFHGPPPSRPPKRWLQRQGWLRRL